MYPKFNFNIDQIEGIGNEGEFSLSKQQYKSKSMKQEYIDTNLFVDLDLPSGTLWAKYNLGVDSQKLSEAKNWIGNYYAWAETNPKWKYTWDTYDHGSAYNILYKYCSSYHYGTKDSLFKLQLEDDAAYQIDHEWRIPSKYQIEELIENTYSKQVNNYKSIPKLDGIMIWSKINDNHIFIPFCEYIIGAVKMGAKECSLWSSEINTSSPQNAYTLFSSHVSDNLVIGAKSRSVGLPVRPIKIKK